MSRDFVALSNSYIDDVLEGRIITSKQTKQACQRQRDDLQRQDWDYYFDAEAATIACEFCELLTHVAGPLAGERFKLEPWEAFITCCVFGWRHKETGYRRFSRSVVFAGKGNGKSFLHSAWSLLMLCGDSEQGAQVYAAARSEGMSRIVFDTCYQQLLNNDELREAAGLKVMKKAIVHAASGSLMKTVSGIGKGSAGLLPYFVTLDETWSHKSDELVAEMRRGCAKRPNSLMSSISHCGPNLGSVGHQQWEEAVAILSGDLQDEHTFCCLWHGGEYPWTDERAWKAANPNYGVSVSPDSLADAARLAEKLPSHQGIFRTHNLCCWLEADSSWLDGDMLSLCGEKDLLMPDYRVWHTGELAVDVVDELRPFAIGFDLSATQDIAAVVYLTLAYRDGKEHWLAWGDYYSSENTIAASPNPKMKGWAERGLIHACPGYVIDFDTVQRDILKRYRRHRGYGVVENDDGFKIVLCAHDRYQAEMMRQSLVKSGITSVPFAQQAQTFTPPMDWLASLILTSRFHFPYDDEVLRWAFSNVVVHRDRNDNIFPNKPTPDRKIDPVVALIMACAAAMANGGSLMRPSEEGSPRVTFIYEDGSVKQSGADGHLHDFPRLKPEQETPYGRT